MTPSESPRPKCVCSSNNDPPESPSLLPKSDFKEKTQIINDTRYKKINRFPHFKTMTNELSLKKRTSLCRERSSIAWEKVDLRLAHMKNGARHGNTFAQFLLLFLGATNYSCGCCPSIMLSRSGDVSFHAFSPFLKWGGSVYLTLEMHMQQSLSFQKNVQNQGKQTLKEKHLDIFVRESLR